MLLEKIRLQANVRASFTLLGTVARLGVAVITLASEHAPTLLRHEGIDRAALVIPAVC